MKKLWFFYIKDIEWPFNTWAPPPHHKIIEKPLWNGQVEYYIQI